jgi:hypothetical protein
MCESRGIATDHPLVAHVGEPTTGSEPASLASTDSPNPSVHDSSPRTDHHRGGATDARSEQLPPGTEAGLQLPSDRIIA